MHPAARSFEQNLLSYGRGIGEVKAAAGDNPADAQLNAYAAAAEMFAMTGDAPRKARRYLARAEAAAREPDVALLARAIGAWVEGDLKAAIALHRERLRLRPDDLAAAKICQLHHLDRGDADGLLATVRLVLPANEANHYALGQLAFALEQVGDLDGAEAAARRALALASADDPWSLHALAHAFYSRGRVDAAIGLIEAEAELWDRSSAFMLTHAWWHAAIAQLDADKPAAALRIYDDRLLAACPDCVQSLVNAVSLLARLTLRGVDVGGRWDDLADRLAERLDDHVNGFLDLHYLYGLALAGRRREATMLLAGLAGIAADGGRALLAYADGRVAEAAERLGSAGPRLRELGGSSEQRELYELVELDACRRAGHTDRARAILDKWAAARPALAWPRRALEALARAA